MLSIIIPAYNEEKRIVPTLNSYLKFYKKNTEFIVVNDGSTDNTEKVIKNFIKKHKNLRLINQRNQGKGAAVINGMRNAKGNIIAFTDADNATIPEQFNKILKYITKYDVVIASRHIKGAKMNRKEALIERITGRGFNLLVRSWLGLKVQDTQCGAKIFKKQVLNKILPKINPDKWSFDISLLYHAKKNNFKIKEVPIFWYSRPGSKLNIKKAIPGFLKTLLKLRFSKL